MSKTTNNAFGGRETALSAADVAELTAERGNGSTSGGELVTVEVWDWQTRVLHWMNALLVITLLILAVGFEAMDWVGVEKKYRAPFKEAHAMVGYFFLTSLTLRLVWGVMGNRYARFADLFQFGRARVGAALLELRYLLGMDRTPPARSVGHSPLASFFYLFIFVVLVSQALTGTLLAGHEFGFFPGNALESVGDWAEDFVEEVHELGLFLVIFFIGAHLVGLVVHEIKEQSGLFSSMIHGRKYLRKKDL